MLVWIGRGGGRDETWDFIVYFFDILSTFKFYCPISHYIVHLSQYKGHSTPTDTSHADFLATY